MSGSQASYQALDETAQSEAAAAGEGEETKEKPDELERAPSQTSEVDGGKDDGKLGPLGTLVVYCTKQVYLAALILMMVRL